MDRRRFLSGTLAASALAWNGCAATGPKVDGRLMTVTGPIRPSDLGRTLMHEHIVVDFIGAAESTPARVDGELAFQTALPHLRRLRERGVRSLVECTPKHIGRSVALLRRLSEASGLQILTNTGWYAAVEHKYLPPEAGSRSASWIAEAWLEEWVNGIDGTGIRPGFLKLGNGNGPLPQIDAKLVRAAAEVHRRTGATLAIHTGDGAAALNEIRLLREEGVAPTALIWVHAMNDPGPVQIEAARLGAWVSLDGYSLAPQNVLRFPRFLEAHREAGTLNRVLLSHDDGWAVEGTGPRGSGLTAFANGNTAPFESLFTRLMPDLRAKGFSEADLDLLLVDNPREALTPRRRLLT